MGPPTYCASPPLTLKVVPKGISRTPKTTMPAVGPVVGAVRLTFAFPLMVAFAQLLLDFDVKTSVTPVPTSVPPPVSVSAAPLLELSYMLQLLRPIEVVRCAVIAPLAVASRASTHPRPSLAATVVVCTEIGIVEMPMAARNCGFIVPVAVSARDAPPDTDD